MTFDEWFVEYNKTNGLPPAYVVTEDAWNAAIEECTDEVVRVVDNPHLINRYLEALKTPLEGSNDSEVRAS